MSKTSDLVIEHQNALVEFQARLDAFDWFYEYVDNDHRYWTKCESEHDRLIETARQNPELRELYINKINSVGLSDYRIELNIKYLDK